MQLARARFGVSSTSNYGVPERVRQRLSNRQAGIEDDHTGVVVQTTPAPFPEHTMPADSTPRMRLRLSVCRRCVSL